MQIWCSFPDNLGRLFCVRSAYRPNERLQSASCIVIAPLSRQASKYLVSLEDVAQRLALCKLPIQTSGCRRWAGRASATNQLTAAARLLSGLIFGERLSLTTSPITSEPPAIDSASPLDGNPSPFLFDFRDTLHSIRHDAAILRHPSLQELGFPTPIVGDTSSRPRAPSCACGMPRSAAAAGPPSARHLQPDPRQY
jgi:hypothetical protein